VPALIRLTAKLPLELREFRYAIAAVSTHLKMCSSSSAGPVRLSRFFSAESSCQW
jgi:hypothetical protein